MFDFLLIDNDNGSDLIPSGSDLKSTFTYEGMIYLALFSGEDFWANNLLSNGEKIICQTEKALISNPLSSAGRVNIENAIKADLVFIKKQIPDADIDVQTRIVSNNALEISVRINRLVYVYEYKGDKTIYLGSNPW